MRQVLALIIGLAFISGCDEDRQACLPVGLTQEKPPPPQSTYADTIAHVSIVLDRSQGMAGFQRQKSPTDPVNPIEAPYGAILRALPSLAGASSVYRMPPTDPNGRLAPVERLDLRQSSASLTCDGRKESCPRFDNTVLLSKFIEAAIAGQSGMDGARLSPDSSDALIIVTDLQPDSDPSAKGETNPRQVSVQDTLRKVIEARLTVGIVPVVSQFFGNVYDTQATDGTGSRQPTPQLDRPGDRQPFFLLVIGRDKEVTPLLAKLREIRTSLAPGSKDYETVLFRSQPPPFPTAPFALSPELPKGFTNAVPPASPGNAFAQQVSMTLSLNRDAVGPDGAQIEFRLPVDAAEQVDLPRYRFIVDSGQQAAANLWRYLGGAYAAPKCQDRWTALPEPSARQIYDLAPLDPATGVPGIALRLHSDAVSRLLVGSMLLIDQPLRLRAVPAAQAPPRWVDQWTFPQGTPWQKWRDEAGKREGRVSIGVNNLNLLFSAMVASSQPAPVDRRLRLAIKVEQP